MLSALPLPVLASVRVVPWFALFEAHGCPDGIARADAKALSAHDVATRVCAEAARLPRALARAPATTRALLHQRATASATRAILLTMTGSLRPSGLHPVVRGEVILPFPDDPSKLEPARRYRSTWVLSSLGALKANGHYERYLTLLPQEHHEAVLFAVAGVWLPMKVARAHYEACDALALTHDEQINMGMHVGRRAQGTILSTAVAMAKVSGVTPWTVLPQYDRLYRRGADGGACAVWKLGPKEALIEIVGCELFAVEYFRAGFCGVLLNVASLFCTKAYLHDQTRRPARSSATFCFQWA